jgi:hypothetical protein
LGVVELSFDIPDHPLKKLNDYKSKTKLLEVYICCSIWVYVFQDSDQSFPLWPVTQVVTLTIASWDIFHQLLQVS